MTSLLAVIAGLFVAHGPAAAPPVRWFHSPSGNIQCELSAGAPRGTYAYCQTFSPARSVTLKRDGTLHRCTGAGCLGNGPENAFTLGYGRSVVVGPFRCTSLRRGMRCVVASSGRGFVLSRAGVTRV